VLEASDGAIALRLAAGHVGEIDLVLTDVVMPNLGGRGMVEELRELSPGLRVLFMSGYQKDEVFPEKGSANRVAYLQKPFTSETLAGGAWRHSVTPPRDALRRSSDQLAQAGESWPGAVGTAGGRGGQPTCDSRDSHALGILV